MASKLELIKQNESVSGFILGQQEQVQQKCHCVITRVPNVSLIKWEISNTG